MSSVAIPNWNHQGVLPPINQVNPTSVERSPYAVTLTELVLRFGTSSERQSILAGFLQFRSTLHAIGLVNRFQWVDGSFLFNPILTKEGYHVDAYFVQLNGGAPEPLVQLSAYWYSLWSHRRNEQWKGYLQIDLSSVDDSVAKANLDKMTNQGDQP